MNKPLYFTDNAHVLQLVQEADNHEETNRLTSQFQRLYTKRVSFILLACQVMFVLFQLSIYKIF